MTLLPYKALTTQIHFQKPLRLHTDEKQAKYWGCPGVPVHEGIPIVFITIHGLMTQFVIVSFFCVPVHEDTTKIFLPTPAFSQRLHSSKLKHPEMIKRMRPA